MTASEVSQSNLSKWTKIISEWKQTKLSQAEFCRINNIVSSQFYYWKTKIIPATSAPNKKNQNLVRVIPSSADFLSEQGQVEISLPNGIVIKSCTEMAIRLIKKYL